MNDGQDEKTATEEEIEIRLHWNVAKQLLRVDANLEPIKAFPIVASALNSSLKCCLAAILLMPPEEQPKAADTLMTALMQCVPSLPVLCVLHDKWVQGNKP